MKECSNLWRPEECPSRAVCTPTTSTNSTTGACSCELHIDMASTGPDGSCDPTTSTYIYWVSRALVNHFRSHDPTFNMCAFAIVQTTQGVLVVLILVCAAVVARAVIRTRNIFRIQDFKADTLTLTCIGSSVSEFLLTFRLIMRLKCDVMGQLSRARQTLLES